MLKSKVSFFQHMRNGGGKLSNREAPLHLKFIGLFLIRYLRWRSRLGEEYFMLENDKDDIEEETLLINKTATEDGEIEGNINTTSAGEG